MKVLIFPVRENEVEDFRKIDSGLRAVGEQEYASWLWKKLTVAEVEKIIHTWRSE